MNWQQHITQSPDVLGGKPVVRGTRISVELILERLAAGWSEAELLDAYPTLKPEHVRAACACAAAHLSLERLVSVEEASA